MKQLLNTIRVFIFGETQCEWDFGFCGGAEARKHKKHGNVQFVLWKAGEQGHEKDFWHDFDKSWWTLFQVK